MSGQFELLKLRRFLPFFITQFFGAFNDNMLKNALIVLLTFKRGLREEVVRLQVEKH